MLRKVALVSPKFKLAKQMYNSSYQQKRDVSN